MVLVREDLIINLAIILHMSIFVRMMIKHNLNFLTFKLYALLGIICLSCVLCSRTPTKALLNDVESFIQPRPDSALTTLRQIDTVLLRKPSERAQYSLLCAMAFDKNDIDTTDLRVIRPALDYYSKKGTQKQKMLSYYYAGRILYNAKRDAEAMVCQLQALECAQNTDAGRYLGMIYTSMADLSSRSYCLEESAEYIKKAEDAFLLANDSLSFYLAKGREVNNLSNQGYMNEALSVADSLLEDPKIPSSLLPPLLLVKAGIMVDTAIVNYQPALDCFFEAFQLGGRPSTKQKARYAYALARCGYEKESSILFSSLLSANKADQSAGAWKQELLADEGKYEEAYQLLYERLVNQEETVIQILNQSLFRTQRDYFHTLERNATIQRKEQLYLFTSLLMLAILILVLLSLFTIYLTRKAKKKQIEMERLAQFLQNTLKEKDQTLTTLQTEFRNMHDVRFRQLEQYYKDYEIARRSGAGERVLYEKLLATIHDIEGDTEGQRYFDRLIDQKYDGIMRRLHEECPGLSKQDYLLFSYSAAGFDISTIGMLLGNISADAIHMRRSRLRRVIRSRQMPSNDDFMKVLEMRP